ncbi:hypothetical protein AB0D98_31145, partial [Streptomyces sp. NPDC047987]|uniref:hypothetical protein n=1 Tax=Streptomyces sp. NPDC047987 TaxID=3154925 RepID=UPI00343E2DDF
RSSLLPRSLPADGGRSRRLVRPALSAVAILTNDGLYLLAGEVGVVQQALRVCGEGVPEGRGTRQTADRLGGNSPDREDKQGLGLRSVDRLKFHMSKES